MGGEKQHFRVSETRIWRYHDGVRPVAIGLTLQSHGAEGAGDVALRSGHRQRGTPDVTHLGGDEKRQHTLTRENSRTKMGRRNTQCASVRRSPPLRRVRLSEAKRGSPGQ